MLGLFCPLLLPGNFNFCLEGGGKEGKGRKREGKQKKRKKVLFILLFSSPPFLHLLPSSLFFLSSLYYLLFPGFIHQSLDLGGHSTIRGLETILLMLLSIPVCTFLVEDTVLSLPLSLSSPLLSSNATIGIDQYHDALFNDVWEFNLDKKMWFWIGGYPGIYLRIFLKPFSLSLSSPSLIFFLFHMVRYGE
jgi:hypothetical protein